MFYGVCHAFLTIPIIFCFSALTDSLQRFVITDLGAYMGPNVIFSNHEKLEFCQTRLTCERLMSCDIFSLVHTRRQLKKNGVHKLFQFY